MNRTAFIPVPFLLDGATGTNLQAAGMGQGECPELWVLEHPDVLRKLQRAYIDAGSHAVYASTFGANRIKLQKAGVTDVAALNRQLAALSRSAADGRALVGGDLAPLGLFLAPSGDSTFEELVDVYREQVEALEEAGVDFYAIETMMTAAEARAAAIAVRETSDKPFLCTVTCEPNGRMLYGTTPEAALFMLAGLGASAFGLNCSSGPEGMVDMISHLYKISPIQLIAKPNAGLPEVKEGKTVFHMGPEAFAGAAGQLRAAGASLLGGCCGTTPAHIAALAQALPGVSAPAAAEAPSFLPATTEKELCRLTRETLSFETVDTTDIEGGLLDADPDGGGALRVRLDSRERAEEFLLCAFMARHPVCLSASDADVLRHAVRGFCGRVLVDGDAACAEELAQKYGALRV